MKRKLFSLKTLIFKPMVSACVFLVVVFLGMVGIFAVNNLTINQIRSTDEPSGKLTADKWDSLVALVNGQATTITTLQNQLTILSGNVANSLNTTSVDIPAGAIWAFDLSACPSGWTRFSAADNRFIMGASSNFKTTGGRSSLTLSTSQLPSHSHYISANGGNVLNDWIGNQPSYAVASHNGRTEGDNNYWYGMRPSSVSANAGKSSTVGSGASIDIQNPYIKLIYCKKN